MDITVSIPISVVDIFKQGLYKITRVSCDDKTLKEIIKNYLLLNIEHGVAITQTQANIYSYLEDLSYTGELNKLL